jgi:hypothetical protein
MSIPATDIDALHTAIKSAIEDQFDGVTVAFYQRPGERVATPGILLELDDILSQDPDDMGTEQLPVTLNFNAYVVLDYKTGNKQAVKTMAGALMAFIHRKRWGQPVSAAAVNGSFPDRIRGKEQDYEVMRVEFAHEAVLGTDVWAGDGIMPWQVYLGISPLIGPDHVDDYDLIYEGDEPEAPAP